MGHGSWVWTHFGRPNPRGVFSFLGGDSRLKTMKRGGGGGGGGGVGVCTIDTTTKVFIQTPFFSFFLLMIDYSVVQIV